MRSARRGSLEQHLPWPEPREDEQLAPEVWKCRLPASGEVIAIVRREADAGRLCSDMLVFSLAEVAVAIQALGEAALEAKRAFPGATVTAVRNRSSAAEPKEGRTQRNATRKPTCGREQSLSKKMPKDTLYKGETYPANNIEARYEEHMQKQREQRATVAQGGKR